MGYVKKIKDMYTYLNFSNVKIIHNPLPWLLLASGEGRSLL